MRHDRFHGRIEGQGECCHAPGCNEAGEFRAPGGRRPGFDGPGDYRWFCLEHVRAFNAGYDFFKGMSADEILDAQSPTWGWAQETRAFSATAGVDGGPRWADFADPLDAIGARVRDRVRESQPEVRADGLVLGREEIGALKVLGLSPDADRAALRQRYSVLVRRFHPDRNGGDRSYETRLQRTVEAYQLLRKVLR